MNDLLQDFAPTADPRLAEEACRESVRLAGWWTRAAHPERWPLSTDEAAMLLADAGQYAVDADKLLDLIGRQLLARPAVEGDAFEWSAEDVCRAVAMLECRRQWQPFSVHDAKRTAAEKLLEEARENDELHLIVAVNGPRYDLRQLLELLVRSEVHEGRRKIATLLMAVLETDHGIRL